MCVGGGGGGNYAKIFLLSFWIGVEDPYSVRTCICNLRLHQLSREVSRATKTGLSPEVVFILTVSKQFLCWRSLCVFGLIYGVCPYLFLIFPSFGISGGLCFMMVAFPRFLHLYSYNHIVY